MNATSTSDEHPHLMTKAIILVGGRGTRLQPLTDTRPKPMLPIAGKPFLEHQLSWLKRNGVNEVVFACGFMPKQIINYFGDGSAFGMKMEYVVEPEPLDTAGAIAFAARTLDRECVVVCNGDVLTTLDLAKMKEQHRATGAAATIALTPVEDPSRYGLVRTRSRHVESADGMHIEVPEVIDFLEKPSADQIDTNLINAGTYILEPEIIDMIPENVRCNIEREIFPKLAGRGLYAFPSDAYWNDIGTFSSYIDANVDTLNLGQQVEQSNNIVDSAIADDAVVSSGAIIERSVILEGAIVGDGAELRGVVVGERAVIDDGVKLESGAVVGPGEHVLNSGRTPAT